MKRNWWRFWARDYVPAITPEGTRYVLNPLPYQDFYGSNYAVRSVIDTIAGSLASVPLKFYNSHKDKVATLSDFCDDDYTFIFDLTVNLLRGKSVTVCLDGRRIQKCEHDHTRDNVKNVTLSGRAWAGRLDALADELRESKDASAYRQEMWGRGGRIAGYITRPVNAPHLSSEAHVRLATSWHEFQKGGARAGETPILEDGMQYHTATLSAKESEWEKSQELLLQHVANCYNMPINLLTGGASDRDKSHFYSDTLAGPARVISNAFTQLLNKMWYARFNFDAKLSGDFLDRAKILSTLAGRPVLSLNEARAIIDYSESTGEGIVTPLNVLEGGQTSPQDGGELFPAYEVIKELTKQENRS